ncbi:DNA-binding protein [Mycobacterium sp. CSUR Q5927]|nr:DNA-binding protein [Mycobacterium sp. CSUR Q5927]
MKTYSLADVSAMVLPEEWTDGERWLTRRLNRGEIRGYRVGRIWRMTQDHIDWFIEHFSNRVKADAPVERSHPISVVDGLSARGRARVRSVS